MTLEVVLFDDIELWATSYLRTALAARDEDYTDNVHVDIESPAAGGKRTTPDRMVTVRRDGGPRLDVAREQARLSVNVWAESDALGEQVCNDLARMVAALLWAAPDGNPVVKVDQTSGPSVIPDDRPHRFMTFDVIQRGTSA